MQIGMLGLGRMGSNMLRRLSGKGNSVWCNHHAEAVEVLRSKDVIGTVSLEVCPYGVDLPEIGEDWRCPWLLDLTASVLVEDAELNTQVARWLHRLQSGYA